MVTMDTVRSSFPRACQDESSIGYAPAKSLTAKNAKKAAKDAKKDLKFETPWFSPLPLRFLCELRG